MNYRIIGQTVPVVEITLNRNQSVYTQSGAMAYRTSNIEMITNTHGGIMKGFGRMLVGESFFIANYTSNADGETIAFASTVPGAIIPINLGVTANSLIFQKNAFLCAEQSVTTNVTFTKRLGAGLFGGEGFVLQQAVGNGMLFLEIDGDMIEKVLGPGEVLMVDTGNVVAFENSVSYDVETVKGFGNILLGGEGLFLTRLVGPGRVILQSQNFRDFANKIIPYMPKNTSNNR